MGLFSWLKKKQKEIEIADVYDPAQPDGDRTGMVPIRRETDALEQELTNFQERPLRYSEPDIVGGQRVEGERIKIKAILSNKTLTVYTPGGDVIVNNNASSEMLQQVLHSSSETEIRGVMLAEDLKPEEKSIISKVIDDRKIMEAIPDLLSTEEFRMEDGALYLIGIDLSIPSLLAREIIKAGEKNTSEYYDALKNFWCWCALNPDPIAREDIFGFLERGDFKITKNGFFLGFRNVVKKDNKSNKQSKELVEFISAKYLNIKLKQKKSPKNFDVLMDQKGEYSITKIIPGLVNNGSLGNLADLYNGLGEMEDNEYTDAYTKSMSIKIGVPVRMDREKCDNDPHSECSRGLHIGNKAFGYQSFGNTTILVAVNPMNVVAVPKHDANKMRTCEYFPLAVLDDSNSNYLEDADTLSLQEEYASEEMKNLMELVTGRQLTEGTSNKLVSNSLVTQVVEKLEEYQKVVSQRVVKA